MVEVDDGDVRLGPLVSQAHFDKVVAAIARFMPRVDHRLCRSSTKFALSRGDARRAGQFRQPRGNYRPSGCFTPWDQCTGAATRRKRNNCGRLTGPVWIVKDAPGAAEYNAFYKAAVEKGWIFGDPRAAKAQPGQARAMAEMYNHFAEVGGIAYESDIQIKIGVADAPSGGPGGSANAGRARSELCASFHCASGRASRGQSVYSLLAGADRKDPIVAMLPVGDLTEEDKVVVFLSKGGVVKRTSLADFANPRSAGIIAAGLKDGDEVLDVALSDGSADVMLLTSGGRAIRASSSSGPAASGSSSCSTALSAPVTASCGCPTIPVALVSVEMGCEAVTGRSPRCASPATRRSRWPAAARFRFALRK